MNNYYQSNLASFARQQPLTVPLVQKQWDDEQAVLQSRVAAADAYRKLMTSLANAHHKLARGGNKLTAKEILTEIGPDIADAQSQLTTIQSALK